MEVSKRALRNTSDPHNSPQSHMTLRQHDTCDGNSVHHSHTIHRVSLNHTTANPLLYDSHTKYHGEIQDFHQYTAVSQK